MKIDLLHSMLIDVRDRGSICIEKKKLLWMVGRKNDGHAVWTSVLNEWEELGGIRADLHGVEYSLFITLINRAASNVTKDWAAE